MVERNKRYNELRSSGFYFEKDKDQMFYDFLDKIEELSKKHNTLEINYYHAFEYKLNEFKNYTEGREPPERVPIVKALYLSVTCKKEQGKDATEKYKISEIKVSYIKKLMEHKNTRYS